MRNLILTKNVKYINGIKTSIDLKFKKPIFLIIKIFLKNI